MAAGDDVVIPDVTIDWRHKPSGEDLAHAYPEKASAEGVTGSATIQCQSTIDGYLEQCKVLSEQPSGYGFGAAALSMTPQFQMEPGIQDGAPHGGTVRIPIAFKLPTEEPATALGASEADTVGVVVLGGALLLVIALLALNDWMRGKAGAPRVRLWRGILFALRFIPRAWRAAPGPLAVCAAMAAGDLAASLAWPDNSRVGLLLTAPMLVAQVFAYAACHRVALQGCDPRRMALGPVGFQAKAVERDVALSWLITGVMFVGAIIAVAIVAVVLAVAASAAAGETATVVTAAAVAGLAAGAVLYVAGRLYFAPAAFAVKGIDGLSEAWRLARGAVFAGLLAMLVGLLLLFVTVGLLVAPFLAANRELNIIDTMSAVAALVSAIALLPFSAALISYFYLDATGAAEGV